MYEAETDSAMGVKVLGLNVRIGGRDVMITIEEARILEGNLHEALHSPIDPEVPAEPVETPSMLSPITFYPSKVPYPEIEWTCEVGRLMASFDHS